MNNLEIIQNLYQTIIINNNTKRKFLVDLDKKIPIYGFGKLNQKEILLNKLNSNDYAFYEDSTKIILTFNISNGKKNCTYNLECEEIFPDAYEDEDNENITNDGLKKIILSLRHQVRYLEHKLKDKDDEFDMYKEQIDYQMNNNYIYKK